MEKRTGPNGPAAEEREQALAREIRVKDALIHEVHHRVKNNLQTVESLMRLHIRRCPSEEARSVLVEAMLEGIARDFSYDKRQAYGNGSGNKARGSGNCDAKLT